MELAIALSNRKVQDNLRDGLPYPYTEQDGKDYISDMLSAKLHIYILSYLPRSLNSGHLDWKALFYRVFWSFFFLCDVNMMLRKHSVLFVLSNCPT